MGFTTPCFIRKDTQELRKKLEELGYKPSIVIFDNKKLCLATAANKEYAKYTNITNEMFDSKDPHITWNCAGRIDCGTNEELFLALAALRDDTDKFQWFISPEGIWAYNKNNDSISVSPKWRKATVYELIEHFKTKEE
ncbi:hypothetical protein [Phocaeicola dorei]|jgi:2'-5' RNA ligase|uniref:Uncharacterized protein n=1 Tax=Phocaeicola dorei CL02T12C06 TaxID=997876 RepID=I9F8Y2_9BACT|nr:hypothetical protein [Phocaeicola dorei]EIY19737.1 hypothetical protein HMPREF1063_04199 [Phocaeicola dorei CL02T00C15]EIY29589.1 hypothetical protein HMPREF1064_03787 [Phocaeicola dorei CL02T12C06]MCE8443206.1 hypothetical protein [Phocaeicola dorei]DAH03888.1 MAG TPA: hypothetical protein [Caudoviricetes sp.]